jgi:hypothetical protein
MNMANYAWLNQRVARNGPNTAQNTNYLTKTSHYSQNSTHFYILSVLVVNYI